MLETVGNLSAIERVEGVRAISNGLTIDGFQALHTDRLPTWVSECVPRRRRSEELAGSARGPLELMRSLRDHGSGLRVPSYGLLNGAMRCICMHGGGLVASSQTTASWVADLAPGRVQHWVTGTSAPCVSLFKPVRVDQPLQLSPTPTDRSDGTSLWWRHERLHRRALQDPATLIPLIAPERDELEAQWVKEVPDSGEAFAVGDEALARWLRRVDSEPIRDVRPAWVRRYWKLRNEWAELTLPR